MPQTRHVDKHFAGRQAVRDIIVGLADGLTVPFALAAGLCGALVSSNVIVVAGLAEITAGSIAMGLGKYLAARDDSERYATERRREENEIIEKPAAERQEIFDLLREYGVRPEQACGVVDAIQASPSAWVDFMMRFELGLEWVHPSQGRNSAMTIAASYAVGGLLPLAPYVLLGDTRLALTASAIVTVLCLLTFGYVKGRFARTTPVRSAIHTTLVGVLAAGAAFLIARWIS